MAGREFVTCGTCGEEYDVSRAEADQVAIDGYYECTDCSCVAGIAAFDFTDDRRVFASAFEW